MNLIKVIEISSIMVTGSTFWPRIKAALEAAQEMDEACVGRDHYMPASIESLARAQRKFRAAMEGKNESR